MLALGMRLNGQDFSWGQDFAKAHTFMIIIVNIRPFMVLRIVDIRPEMD